MQGGTICFQLCAVHTGLPTETLYTIKESPQKWLIYWKTEFGQTCPPPPFTNVGSLRSYKRAVEKGRIARERTITNSGPIEVKRGRALVQRYGIMFTFMVSRAVQSSTPLMLILEVHVLQSLSMPFEAQTSSERELREAIAALDHSRIQDALLKRGIYSI
ncbi:hypothetical protein N1851_033652 [Merluccius polli]|uniref:Uncharacterized protein n=1 Tax=Merluccius polli TaxID=89951 RepID=A0AA47M102_MERPO|nr:hypothetical protein N1851_033652 [Merluccius polli]